MRRLHRPPDYPPGLRSAQSRSVSSRSLAEKASRVFLASYLPAVEAPVYEGLDAAPQGIEQRGDHESGDDNGQLGLLLLAGERTEDRLGRRHAPEVDSASITVREP